MAVTDLWVGRDKQPTLRHGRGLRWRVTIPGHPSRSFATKGEAKAWEAELLRLGQRRQVDALVGDLVEKWMQGKGGLSERGQVACRGDARHVLDVWGDRWVSTIETHEVQTWIADMRVRRGTKRAPVWKPASEALRRRLFQCLAASLQIAVPRAIDSNPCDGVRVPRDHRREGVFLTVEQVRTLAVAADPYGPLVWLLATSGMRVGEATSARVQDVDVPRGRIRVVRAKGMRGRDVPVPATVLAMLDLTRPGQEPLIVNGAGRALHPDTFRARQWKRAVSALGVEGLRIHDLRHTAASLAIESGADVKAVQTMLGHKSATLTLDTYGHLLDSRLDDVSARMDKLL